MLVSGEIQPAMAVHGKDAALLRAMKSDLVRLVLPEVASSPLATMAVNMVIDALMNLIAQDIHEPVLAAARNTVFQDIVGRHGGDFAGRENGDPEGTLDRLLRSAYDEGRPERNQIALETIRAGMDHMQAVSQALAAEDAEDAIQRDQALATVTAERFQSYWVRRFPGSPDAQVTAFRPLPGGFGKTTILFEVTGWEAQPAQLVMRRDVIGSATETSVIQEYPIIQAAAHHGVPAPALVFLEADPSELDRPFLVMRRAEGEPAGSLWQVNPQCNADTGRDIARAMGRLHAMPLSEIGIAADIRPRDAILRLLAEWRASLEVKRARPDPVMDACLGWLEDNVPEPSALPFVHGDMGFWNLLIEQGRLTALLDWELWHIGDTSEELAYVKASVEEFMSWEEFLDAYNDAGGRPYDAKAVAYYDIWRDVRNAIFAVFADHGFRSGANPELRMAHCGFKAYDLLLMRASAKIASAIERAT